MLLAIVILNAMILMIGVFLFRRDPYVGEMSGIRNTLDVFPLMFYSILGMQFFIGTKSSTGATFPGMIPAAEFLLVRPVSRRTAYLSRMVFFFFIMLIAPLLGLGLTIAEPDLQVSLYHSKTESTEAADNITLYQKQFPDNFIIHKPKATHDTLVIPFGSMLLKLWEFWLVVCLALALQAVVLVKLPAKIQTGLFMGIGMSPFLLVSDLFWNSSTIAENAFFFFAHHWSLIALFTLGAFILVQRIALKRIQEVEVI
jgi:hypothetical protein